MYLAGAFGNYINQSSARRIGLLNFSAEKIQAVGNSALLGCKLALFNTKGENFYAPILRNIQHVSLNEDAGFQDVYVREMTFPADLNLQSV